jgi:uncharacterized protein (TIGR04255 family)
MGIKMKSAPVYFTIAQLRHNPILSLDSYVPAIQERMRKAGFPDFKRGVLAALSFSLGPGNETGQQSVMQKVERFTFSNMETTRGFVLLQDAISYQSTDYETYENFSRDFLMGVEILHEAVKLDFSQRIGIRYLDAIVPREGEEPQQYLVPEVLGLAGRLKEGNIKHSFSETAIEVPNIGQVVARTIIQNGPLTFPPDLQPDALKMAPRFAGLDQVHAVIDTDGAFEARVAFDIAVLKTKLDELHQEISNAFQKTITDHARQTWA